VVLLAHPLGGGLVGDLHDAVGAAPGPYRWQGQERQGQQQRVDIGQQDGGHADAGDQRDGSAAGADVVGERPALAAQQGDTVGVLGPLVMLDTGDLGGQAHHVLHEHERSRLVEVLEA
jgi:hypothetical protein